MLLDFVPWSRQADRETEEANVEDEVLHTNSVAPTSRSMPNHSVGTPGQSVLVDSNAAMRNVKF